MTWFTKLEFSSEKCTTRKKAPRVCNIVYMVFDMSFIDRKMSSESTKILLKELLPINVVLLQFAKSSV